MKRFAGVLVVAVAALNAGCSNSSTGVCCVQVNQSQAAWTCPSQAAFEACCGQSDPSAYGCIVDPTTSPQSACTSVNYASNCSG